MQNFLCKLKSRKFLTCVAGIVMGVCMTFGLDESTICAALLHDVVEDTPVTRRRT